MTAMPSTPMARDDAKVLRQDAASWHEGYQAGYRGSLTTCPYAAGTNQSWSWSSGAIEGKAARLESCQHKIDVNREH
jgi:ribosome modulation factor